MSQMKTLDEVSHEARQALVERLGVSDTIRFLNQFRTGTGDYTRDRSQWLTEKSVDEVLETIRAQKNGPQAL